VVYSQNYIVAGQLFYRARSRTSETFDCTMWV